MDISSFIDGSTGLVVESGQQSHDACLQSQRIFSFDLAPFVVVGLLVVHVWPETEAWRKSEVSKSIFERVAGSVTLVYILVDKREIVYIGRTSRNLDERAQEHRYDGKVFDDIVKISECQTEQEAEDCERRALDQYRRKHNGRNPKYNKT